MIRGSKISFLGKGSKCALVLLVQEMDIEIPTDERNIVNCFKNDTKDEHFINSTNHGYIMSYGVLHRYCPDTEYEEADFVVSNQDRERVLKKCHDAPTADHYVAEERQDSVVGPVPAGFDYRSKFSSSLKYVMLVCVKYDIQGKTHSGWNDLEIQRQFAE
ncbi:hypothetical protein HNY73_006429 [Argiope bruennichi]|uniref:Uncharacterized protein n=1 Tax=Argiope bruennichi TaxID=94029 RepID=A0A8T0FK12_ARGBR|nr:hypothetical protein HNY73_006429 [Argiope bruennichi]